jgi:hypothetical protein
MGGGNGGGGNPYAAYGSNSAYAAGAQGGGPPQQQNVAQPQGGYRDIPFQQYFTGGGMPQGAQMNAAGTGYQYNAHPQDAWRNLNMRPTTVNGQPYQDQAYGGGTAQNPTMNGGGQYAPMMGLFGQMLGRK